MTPIPLFNHFLLLPCGWRLTVPRCRSATGIVLFQLQLSISISLSNLSLQKFCSLAFALCLLVCLAESWLYLALGELPVCFCVLSVLYCLLIVIVDASLYFYCTTKLPTGTNKVTWTWVTREDMQITLRARLALFTLDFYRKVCNLAAGPQKYPSKQQSNYKSSSLIFLIWLRVVHVHKTIDMGVPAVTP